MKNKNKTNIPYKDPDSLPLFDIGDWVTIKDEYVNDDYISGYAMIEKETAYLVMGSIMIRNDSFVLLPKINSCLLFNSKYFRCATGREIQNAKKKMRKHLSVNFNSINCI